MMRNDRKKPAVCEADFKGRRVVITGATSGIGLYTAREFARHGADLLVINRSEEKSRSLRDEIQDQFGVKCDYKIADFSHLSDVRRVGRELLNSDMSIDVFIHNAGVFSTGKQITDDGNELVFQVQYLASFILNYMLMDKLKAEGKARIIFVNSEGHRFLMSGLRLDDLDWQKHRYKDLESYGAAKTAQLLSMIKFNEYFEGSGVTINAMHPGNVKTNMGENNGRLYRFWKHKFINPFAKSPEISSTALYYLGASSEMDGISGKFFNLTTEEETAAHASDREAAEKLWDISIDLAGIK